MEFRLTYAGQLLCHRDDGTSIRARAPHKHEIRQEFHRQLKNLWHKHPNLSYRLTDSATHAGSDVEELANKFNINGFRFVPLVTKANNVVCKLEILLLRDGLPGNLVGDIDNRLKTIFDALKMPINRDQLGGATPAEDGSEDPFFVLLEDDSLITHVAVETDMLLQPVKNDLNDVRLVIAVTTKLHVVHMDNLDYV